MSQSYSLPPLNLETRSRAFCTFIERFFVDPRAVLRFEVDFDFLRELTPDERELARECLHRNIAAGYHVTEGLGELGNSHSATLLRQALAREADLSRQLSLAKALWKIERDPVFPDLLEQMAASPNTVLKEAHLHDVRLLQDARAVDLLIRLTQDEGAFVRALALSSLNELEFRRHFLLPSWQLPHDGPYYLARRHDDAFIAQLVFALLDGETAWQTESEPAEGDSASSEEPPV